jgi:hypothetical protein
MQSTFPKDSGACGPLTETTADELNAVAKSLILKKIKAGS